MSRRPTLEQHSFMDYVENCGTGNLSKDELKRWRELRRQQRAVQFWQGVLIFSTVMGMAVLSTVLSLWIIFHLTAQ